MVSVQHPAKFGVILFRAYRPHGTKRLRLLYLSPFQALWVSDFNNGESRAACVTYPIRQGRPSNQRTQSVRLGSPQLRRARAWQATIALCSNELDFEIKPGLAWLPRTAAVPDDRKLISPFPPPLVPKHPHPRCSLRKWFSRRRPVQRVRPCRSHRPR